MIIQWVILVIADCNEYSYYVSVTAFKKLKFFFVTSCVLVRKLNLILLIGKKYTESAVVTIVYLQSGQIKFNPPSFCDLFYFQNAFTDTQSSKFAIK